MTGVFINRGNLDTNTERGMPCEDIDTQGEHHVKTETEIGVLS